MKVRIDYGICMGERNCFRVCPEVFGFDEDRLQGKVLVEVVPRQLETKAREAAEACGVKAIAVED